MKILRVFPRRTHLTPIDEYSFVGDPPLFRPLANEVHISVTFTWDILEGNRLKKAWEQYYPVVKIGGPAISGSNGEFIPGRYLKEGVTITSRGCSRKCPWCLVPEMEGRIKLLEIKSGYIVQDNNLLATPRSHQEKVYEMLRKNRKGAIFSGGIDARLVDNWVADQFRTLKIDKIFIAADTKNSLTFASRAGEKLSFLEKNSNKMRCYVMVGYDGETLQEAEERLLEVWKIGFVPFAQPYQPRDKFIHYSKEWKDLVRKWSRPAIIRKMMGVY